MSEIILFSITGIAVYFTSDWLLRLIEQRRDKPLENRGIMFFIIFLVLIMASFELIPMLLKASS